MLTDEMILKELEQLPVVTIPYIQRKYARSHAGARKLQHKWVENEPKEPTFEEKLLKYTVNPQKITHKVKKRFTAFRLGDRFFDTYAEFEISLQETQ